MSALSVTLNDYLALRRGLGHQLADAARLLPHFVAWMDATDRTTVTVAAAMEWAQQPDAEPGTTVWARRMEAVRGFARFLVGIDPATEVPPLGLLPLRNRWRPPFIYSTADITALLHAAASLPSPRRAATYETLFGLLAATGMRVGEAIRLDVSDVDWERGVLLVRESKFGKSRNVPVTASTLDALNRYAQLRPRFRPEAGNPSFFVSLTGRRLIYVSVHDVFAQLRIDTGIGASSTTTARIHDLRHSFAVATLLDWYRNGDDVAARLPWLSTYLGHREPRTTYWYLSAAPELLAAAAKRLEPFATQAVTPWV
jgi:integrase/recombinase XerD